jgi:hypothetical protein
MIESERSSPPPIGVPSDDFGRMNRYLLYTYFIRSDFASSGNLNIREFKFRFPPNVQFLQGTKKSEPWSGNFESGSSGHHEYRGV